MNGQLKDKEFKKIALELFPEGYYNNYWGSDFYLRIKNQEILIEYENSSRGLTSNILKILRKVNCDQNIIIVCIRTENHVKKHNTDYLNALYIRNNLRPKNVQILFFEGKSQEWIKLIRSLK